MLTYVLSADGSPLMPTYKVYLGFRQDRSIAAASVVYQVMDYIARQG